MYRNWLNRYISLATPLLSFTNPFTSLNDEALVSPATLFSQLRRHSLWLVAAIFLLSLNACSLERVKPWQRDLLAAQKMQLDPSPVESALDEHIYFSKEASSGGAGVGGGGCGCN